MSTISSIGFRGDTTGTCPSGNCPKPQVITTNFKAYPADSYESSTKKKSHAGLAIIGSLVTAAGLIALMGYSHKAGWVDKIKNEKIKNFANTVTEKCHDWCSWTKNKAVSGWETVKGWFKKKD